MFVLLYYLSLQLFLIPTHKNDTIRRSVMQKMYKYKQIDHFILLRSHFIHTYTQKFIDVENVSVHKRGGAYLYKQYTVYVPIYHNYFLVYC